MDVIRRTDEGRVARLTLASAKTRNALSLDMIEALIVAFAATDGARAVVIDAEGPAFSAGHDLKELQAHRNDPDGGRAFYERLFTRCGDLMTAIAQAPRAVIASVEGVATAAGCQLMASCDLAVVGAKARFATPGVNIGLFCSTPMVAVSRTIAPKHAMELLLTGDMIDAQTALRMGLVNRVTEEGAALAEAMALAVKIAEKSPQAIAMGKPVFHAQAALPLGEAYARTAAVMTQNMLAGDPAEGISAFLEKREPDWEGR